MVAAKAHDDWDPRSPEVLADQTAAYDEMRRGCPVAHSEYLGWSVFRHEDVVAVAEDHARFSSAVSAAHPAVPNGYDPPVHGQYRHIVDHYFGAHEMAGFAPFFRDLALELARDLPLDGTVEFIDEFALTFALKVQRAWLGWPLYTEQALREWTRQNYRATLAGDRAEISRVARDFDATVQGVITQWRTRENDGDDVTSRLLRERIDGRPLTDAEIVSILRNWTVGELGTMAASVGILVEYLASHPDLQRHLRATPGDLPGAIDEILRINSPLLSNRRVTTEAVDLGGRTLEAGERVTVFWASANRDEAVFGDPDEYRPIENAQHNVLYGRGIHDCPGAPLARLELRVALEVLLESTTELRLVAGVEPDYDEYPASGFRTLHLHVTR